MLTKMQLDDCETNMRVILTMLGPSAFLGMVTGIFLSIGKKDTWRQQDDREFHTIIGHQLNFAFSNFGERYERGEFPHLLQEPVDQWP